MRSSPFCVTKQHRASCRQRKGSLEKPDRQSTFSQQANTSPFNASLQLCRLISQKASYILFHMSAGKSHIASIPQRTKDLLRLRFQNQRDELAQGSTDERGPPCGHLVESAPKSPYVCCIGGRGTLLKQLWCHVAGRPSHVLHFGDTIRKVGRQAANASMALVSLIQSEILMADGVSQRGVQVSAVWTFLPRSSVYLLFAICHTDSIMLIFGIDRLAFIDLSCSTKPVAEAGSQGKDSTRVGQGLLEI